MTVFFQCQDKQCWERTDFASVYFCSNENSKGNIQYSTFSKTKKCWAFSTGLHFFTFYGKRHRQRNNVKIIESKDGDLSTSTFLRRKYFPIVTLSSIFKS